MSSGNVDDNDVVILYKQFETKTGGRLDILDVTEEVIETVRESGVRNGSALVFSPHTTCCVLLCSPTPELKESLLATLETIAPSTGYYAHDDLSIRTENLVEDEPANGPAHIAHAVLGKASEAIPIIGGEIALGPRQRVLLVELDSSRPRSYA
ncbi:MAG: secondary thiamine-phosphate synthase enzyme YjbQ, partial [Actinomycetota bacterium]|nr:secondary thiamine-phosphate synthase enzyme YjbQ [Actinomycetota bacterium]